MRSSTLLRRQLLSLHPGYLNTPRLVADTAGTTVWRWDQAEPFGNNPANEDPDGNSVAFDLPLRLPGQRYDAETALHYNYFRDYDPSLGRYGESDPIGLKGGLNTYAYVTGNPLGFTDVFGLDQGLMYPMMFNDSYWQAERQKSLEKPKCSEMCIFEVKPDCRDSQCSMASRAAGLSMSTKTRYYSCKCVLTFGLIGKVGGSIVGQRAANALAESTSSTLVRGAARVFASPAATGVGAAVGLKMTSDECEVVLGEDCCR